MNGMVFVLVCSAENLRVDIDTDLCEASPWKLCLNIWKLFITAYWSPYDQNHPSASVHRCLLQHVHLSTKFKAQEITFVDVQRKVWRAYPHSGPLALWFSYHQPLRGVWLPFTPLVWGNPKVKGGFLKQKQLEGRRLPRGSSKAKTFLELDGQPQKCKEYWGCSEWSQGLDNCLRGS